MDPFLQNLVERNNKRAAALGISNTPMFPLSEFNYEAEKPVPSSAASPKKKAPSRKHSAPKAPPGTTVSSRTVEVDGDRATTLNIGGGDPEDCDVALEINIMTSSNLKVDLGVREMEADGGVKNSYVVRSIEQQQQEQEQSEAEKENAEVKNLIRDQSRNQLQRLGTLYSETQDLSSPVHRTEGRFHEDVKDAGKPKPKLAKLAMLADSINNWEDDTSHPDIKHHRETIVPGREMSPHHHPQSPKRVVGGTTNGGNGAGTGATPKKYAAPNPPKSILSPQKKESDRTARTSGTGKPLQQQKSLKWDERVMDDLELQGFQRRESTATKMVYDYKNSEPNDDKKKPDNYRALQVARANAATATGTYSDSRERTVTKANPEPTTSKPTQKPPSAPTGSQKGGGIVSGRAAMFEKSSGRRQSILKNGQKDPAEMSLKERMAIFEKNKGTALVPKAAFGISPSIRQITGQKDAGKPSASSCSAIQGSGFGSISAQQQSRAPPSPQRNAPAQKQVAPAQTKAETMASGSAIRNTVAALMSNASTISESQIAEDIRRQRQQEMDLLLNRFSKPVDMSSDTAPAYDSRPIPSAPPMPPEGYLTGQKKKSHGGETNQPGAVKRRSDGTNDSPGVMAALDDVKRIRVTGTAKDGRMYPALSDIETTATESGDEGHEEEAEDVGGTADGYTTATVSGSESSDRAFRTCYGSDLQQQQQHHSDEEEYEEYEDDRGHDDNRYEVDEDDDSFMYSDDDANIANVSLGREILQAVELNGRQRSSSNQQHGRGRRQSQDGKRKSSVASNSFSYQKNPSHGNERCGKIEEEERAVGSEKRKSKTPRKSVGMSNGTVDYSTPVRSELQVKPSGDDNIVTLVHTVSFYRRQQQQNASAVTPRRVPRTPMGGGTGSKQQQRGCDDEAGQPRVDSTSRDDDDSGEESVSSTVESTSTSGTTEESEFLVQEKIKKLLDEVCKQQTIIAQASQALNLCAATIEFSGSTESAEGERHLLVATHRRQAILDEVQRLRVEGCLRPPGAPTEKGRLTVKDITLPLKQEYMRKLAADQISGHNLVCLLKYNETVLATQTVPTLPGLLSVRFPDVLQLSNVFADFKITMEIYGMPAAREVLPHEIKYHIAMGGNKKKGGSGSSKLLLHTPKGMKSNSRLVMPPVQSPAGPQAVRSPSLTMYGFIIFSLKEIQRTSWTLNPIAGCASPLEGIVNMRVNCELAVTVDYSGFLTMYEDVSGLGAWHRRWCRLQRHTINYWKYPDDERRKAPIGSIDLQGCSTERRITVAPRDVCSRLNTLMLEFPRPARDDDVESLKIVRRGKTTIERYLLSADSKEERDEWCAHLNKTLALLKAWGCNSSSTS
ncbi:anillin-like isoform X2 [Anopheles albimanus]|uniref:anillin-like isoform X2 n=1 Tax=Anopheles albimanus TaxID=7167 RepID=UPI00163E152F|nr:anillin-like isoform X2 [Anopheles albimanus]